MPALPTMRRSSSSARFPAARPAKRMSRERRPSSSTERNWTRRTGPRSRCGCAAPSEAEMKIRTFAAALLAMAALAMPASSPAQHRRAPVAQRDWSLVATRTPEGGVRIGNPAAPMKLVEYGSISCPHCAAFSGEAAAALRTRYVRTGRASWEYRPYLIFPTDPGLFMLLSCLAPARFFPATEALYATQSQWYGRVQALPADQLQTIQSM